jgi:hypothetical protein
MALWAQADGAANVRLPGEDRKWLAHRQRDANDPKRKLCWPPSRGAPTRSSEDFDDAHHALVFVIDCMTMVDKPTDDCGIGEGDDDLEHARPLVRCRRY